MRRTFVVASLAGAVVLAGLLVLLRPGSSPAKPGKEGADPAVVKPAAQLPIGNVILYSSGVGYFQREGKVTGNTRIDLSFPASDINDLLKSMVLRDLGGGHVSAASYDSHDPGHKTPQAFPLN